MYSLGVLANPIHEKIIGRTKNTAVKSMKITEALNVIPDRRAAIFDRFMYAVNDEATAKARRIICTIAAVPKTSFKNKPFPLNISNANTR